jgi:hypothetical protein
MDNSRMICRDAMIEILEQGVELLESLSDAEYGRRVPTAAGASVGAHFRHCLEHFEPLLVPDVELIDYDARARDRRVEEEREYALDRTFHVLQGCRTISPEVLSRRVRIRCSIASMEDEAPLIDSTLAREAVHAVIHAIHHYALIAMICRLVDAPVPAGFGVAPSTTRHHEGVTSAPSPGVPGGREASGIATA